MVKKKKFNFTKRLELYEIIIENEDIWLDKSFLDWDLSVKVYGFRYFIDLAGCNNNVIHVPHSYLAHALKRININNDGFDRADIISNLKRAVNHRIIELNKIYKLKQLAKIGFLNPKLESLDRLVELGLVRKTLVNNLLNLRNIIEHQYEEGPTKARCEEFIDFSWYFLRSTDVFMKEIAEVFNFSSLNSFLDQDYQSEIEFIWGPTNDWIGTLKGKLSYDLLSNFQKNGFLKITNAVLRKTKSKKGPYFIEGKITQPSEGSKLFLARYFDLVYKSKTHREY